MIISQYYVCFNGIYLGEKRETNCRRRASEKEVGLWDSRTRKIKCQSTRARKKMPCLGNGMHLSDKDNIENSYSAFFQATINNWDKINWLRTSVRGLKLLQGIIAAAENTERDFWQDKSLPNDFLSKPNWD